MSAANLPTRPRIAAMTFDLDVFVGSNPIQGSEHEGYEAGAPLWSCELSTKQISLAEGGAYKWLIAARRGAMRGLYLYDVERPRPLAYLQTPSASAPLASSSSVLASSGDYLASAEGDIHPWGAPQLTAVDADAGTLTLEGFEPGAVVTMGDYGHWDDGLNRRLHILDDGVADGAGALTIRCEPPPPATLIATLPVPFEMFKASAEMIVLESEVNSQFAPNLQDVRIRALQILPE